MPCSLVSAPPTLNTMTATHAIQPTLIINESGYKVNSLIKIFCLFFVVSSRLNNFTCYEQTTQEAVKFPSFNQINVAEKTTERTQLFFLLSGCI